MMVWGIISSRGLGPLVVLRGMIKGDHYRSNLTHHLHPTLQALFLEERSMFQDDNALVHTSRCVQIWLYKHYDEVEHPIRWPQFPDLNIIQPLWSF